jgi:hypothetical protein
VPRTFKTLIGLAIILLYALALAGGYIAGVGMIGEDLDRARREGLRAGSTAGAAREKERAYRRGLTAGRRAGYRSISNNRLATHRP